MRVHDVMENAVAFISSENIIQCKTCNSTFKFEVSEASPHVEYQEGP
jgi:hypothetical protein